MAEEEKFAGKQQNNAEKDVVQMDDDVSPGGSAMQDEKPQQVDEAGSGADAESKER